MDRRRKINDSQIREIFKSPERASALSKRFRISEQTIYLIRSGREHRGITQGLKRGTATRAPAVNVDTIALADAIIDRLIKRLRGRDPKPTTPAPSRRRPRKRAA